MMSLKDWRLWWNEVGRGIGTLNAERSTWNVEGKRERGEFANGGGRMAA